MVSLKEKRCKRKKIFHFLPDAFSSFTGFVRISFENSVFFLEDISLLYALRQTGQRESKDRAVLSLAYSCGFFDSVNNADHKISLL